MIKEIEDKYKEQFVTSHLASFENAQMVLEEDVKEDDAGAKHVASLNFESDKHALEYISGYISVKLNFPTEEPIPGSYIWLKSLCNFKKALPNMEICIKYLDAAFNAFHGNSELDTRSGPNIMVDTVNYMEKFCKDRGLSVPLKVIQLFMKVKFYARIKYINSQIKLSKKQNLRSHVKTGHFLN